MQLYKRLRQLVKGSFRVAVEDGMRVDADVSCMGGVNFGSEPYLIHLHKACRISFNVSFITHDGATWAFRHTNPRYSDVVKYGTIEVGEYSFVGANTTILPGVSIGDNCVIGACSLVTKSIPDGMVAAGVPAKIICTTEEYAQKCLSQMPKSFDWSAYQKDKKSYLIDLLWKK